MTLSEVSYVHPKVNLSYPNSFSSPDCLNDHGHIWNRVDAALLPKTYSDKSVSFLPR